MNNESNSFIIGSLIGLTQTIFGHPFDTLKTIKQSNNNYNIKNIKNVRFLYKGVSYPLIINIGYNGSLFYLFNKMKENNYNNFESGFISGLLSGVILNPFEYYKVNKQINNKTYIFNSFKGIQLTMLRESLATSIYFSTYFSLHHKEINPLLSGGISGVFSWFVTYPIDTIKTNYQVKIYKDTNDVIKKCFNIKYIINKNTWNGVNYCLTRAFIVNSISFYIYNYFDNPKINNFF